MGAIVGDECPLDDDVMAARSAQSERVPVVLDTIIGAREQEGAHIGGPARFGRRHQRPEQHPLAMFRSARKAPASGQEEAALGMLDLADRLVGGRDQHAIILAPDILLRAIGEERQLIGVTPDDSVNPPARHAPFGQQLDDVEEQIGMHLVTAPAARLENPEQASFAHLRMVSSGTLQSTVARAARCFRAGIIARARSISVSALGTSVPPAFNAVAISLSLRPRCACHLKMRQDSLDSQHWLPITTQSVNCASIERHFSI